MSLKYVALTAATLALCAAVNPAPAAAQAPNCGDMYNRVMQLYQAAPLSPEYAQMAGAYGARCLGASAGPAYSPTSGPGYPPPTYGPADGYAPGYVYGPPVDIGIGVGVDGGRGWRR
jgi:hypothetical protein